MALPFLVLYLNLHLGFTTARSAAVLAVYGLVSLPAGPLGGRLADRWGPRATMQLSLILSGVVLILFPLARSMPAVLAMTVLWSVAVESFRPANLSLVGTLGADEHGKTAFALMRFASNLGMSAGPAVGGFLAQVSFPALFVIDGLTALAAAAILGKIKLKAPVHRRDTATKRAVLEPLTNVHFRIFLLGIIPISLVFAQFGSSLSLFMVRNLSLPASAYGLLFTLNTILIVTLEIPLNSATRNWPHRRSLALGSFCMALGTGLLAFARTYFEVAATVVIWTFGEMILFPAMSIYVSDSAPAGRKGEYMGLYLVAFNVAFRFAGPWAGVVGLEYLGATALWLSMFGTGLVSVLALGLLCPTEIVGAHRAPVQ
jgi:MFS family permease